jgi:hypothetical protein
MLVLKRTESFMVPISASMNSGGRFNIAQHQLITGAAATRL